ncbi:MAG: hypothetical protein K0Q84_1740, partial [Arthrobacter sp.]|nr:hypothetical protein [Arthrobacter sp.]
MNPQDHSPGTTPSTAPAQAATPPVQEFYLPSGGGADPDFGLAVLVLAEDDLAAHGLFPTSEWWNQGPINEIKRAVQARFRWSRPN